MYSIRFENNKIDHTPVVVFFVLLWLVLLLLVELWQSYLTISISCIIAALYSIRTIKSASPPGGRITLKDSHLSIDTGAESWSGTVLPGSLLFGEWLALRVRDSVSGKRRWLCLSADAVEAKDFTRLRRAVITARG